MELGTKKRLSRIFNPDTKRTIIVPMDHGMTIGAPDGLVDIRKAVDDMNEGGANAVIMHKGLIRASGCADANVDLGLIMHITASTELCPSGNTKVLTGSARTPCPSTSTSAMPTNAKCSTPPASSPTTATAGACRFS